MSAFLLALSMAISSASAKLEGIFSYSDYPQWAVENGQSAAAVVDLVIEPTGQVSRCDMRASFGSKRLAQEVCRIALRKKARPARDEAGVEVHTVVRTMLKLFLPGTKDGDAVAALKSPPDVELAVSQLPEGRIRADAEVLLTVSEEGSVTSCIAASDQVDAGVAAAVCSVSDNLGASKLLNADGQAVRHITNRKAELRVAPAAQ